ncbi:MAG: hypothetical protein ACUZ8E_04400 [Candidatus Anammoxibacter sp.]
MSDNKEAVRKTAKVLSDALEGQLQCNWGDNWQADLVFVNLVILITDTYQNELRQLK